MFNIFKKIIKKRQFYVLAQGYQSVRFRLSRVVKETNNQPVNYF